MQAMPAIPIRVLCCQSSAMWAPAVEYSDRARPAGLDWCRDDDASDRKVTSRHSEFREQCHGYRLAAPGAAGCGRGRTGQPPDRRAGLGVGDRHRLLDPDHDRGVGRQVQSGGSPHALAPGRAAGGDLRPPAGRCDLRRAVGRGRPGRRRRDRRAGRRGPRCAVSRLAADHGRSRRGRGVHRAAAGRIHRRPQLRHLRPDRRPRPQPVRDDPQPASPQRRPARLPGHPAVARQPVALRPAGHSGAAGLRPPGRYLAGPGSCSG